MERGVGFGFCDFVCERNSDVDGNGGFMVINAGADVMVRFVVVWT
jgi:hypothetical protein